MPKNSYDFVLSSRIRFARNIDGFPFPEWASPHDLLQVKALSKKAIGKVSKSLKYKELAKTRDLERQILVESNILSNHFVKGDVDLKAFAYNSNHVGILINEEDHLRAFVQKKSLNLEECMEIIDRIDDKLSSELQFAFSKELGFATSCPSNVGTAMRASVMLHLPGLCMDGQVGSLISKLSDSHLTVRGLFGEGSMALGHVFQISNLNTLGITEHEIIGYLKKVTQSIVKKELLSRKNLLKGEKLVLKDKVSRAIGILKYAHFLSYEEALDLLSVISLGQSLGIENRIKPLKNLADLSKQLRDGHLRKAGKVPDKIKALELYRAKKVRELVD